MTSSPYSRLAIRDVAFFNTAPTPLGIGIGSHKCFAESSILAAAIAGCRWFLFREFLQNNNVASWSNAHNKYRFISLTNDIFGQKSFIKNETASSAKWFCNC